VTALTVVEAWALRLAESRPLNRAGFTSWQALLDDCATAVGRGVIEEIRILFRDRNNVLIADEVDSKGTADHTPSIAREVVERALDLGASALILMHNRPTCADAITMDHARTN
jgi:DNA repair protein RadC